MNLGGEMFFRELVSISDGLMPLRFVLMFSLFSHNRHRCWVSSLWDFLLICSERTPGKECTLT